MRRINEVPPTESLYDSFQEMVLTRFRGIIAERNLRFTRNDTKMFCLMSFFIHIFTPEIVEFDKIKAGQRFACFNVVADDLCRPHTYLTDNSIFLNRKGTDPNPLPVFRLSQ